MHQQDTTAARQYTLEDSIKKLEATNKKLAKLTLEKEALTAEIIAGIGHQHEGERSYEVNEWKVTVKTPMIYSLDTKAYKSGDVYLDPEFDPIKQSITYTVDKKRFEECMTLAPAEVRETLCELVTKKPSKASVSLKARC
jgi:site-specific DNA-adenine methylase